MHQKINGMNYWKLQPKNPNRRINKFESLFSRPNSSLLELLKFGFASELKLLLYTIDSKT